MQYQVLFCFWLLTFNHDIASDIPKYGHVPRCPGHSLSRHGRTEFSQSSFLFNIGILRYSILFPLANSSRRRHVPATIGSVLSKTQKEKVVRVAVLTIRNILEQSKPDVIKTNVENMVANKLLRSIRGVQVCRTFRVPDEKYR
jgi:hypothetical protein